MIYHACAGVSFGLLIVWIYHQSILIKDQRHLINSHRHYITKLRGD